MILIRIKFDSHIYDIVKFVDRLVLYLFYIYNSLVWIIVVLLSVLT